MQKSKNWIFELYPDSMNPNWKKIVEEELCVPMAVSPLHDKDVNDDGTPKKPHYHVLVMYDGNTTYNNVKKNICDRLNATIPLVCLSTRGSYRYHLHLDNPEKYQYDDRERLLLCGFDVKQCNALTQTQIIQYLKEIHKFINDNDIVEYEDLCTTLLVEDMTNMYEVAITHTMFLNTLISSKRNKLKELKKESSNKLPIIDKELI